MTWYLLWYPTWHDMTFTVVSWYDMTFIVVSWHDMTWHDMTVTAISWHDMTWHLLWYPDMTWHDRTWHLPWYPDSMSYCRSKEGIDKIPCKTWRISLSEFWKDFDVQANAEVTAGTELTARRSRSGWEGIELLRHEERAMEGFVVWCVSNMAGT
jgi:hypothetical protein